MSKNCLFCPKKESSITQKVLIEIFFNVISHLIYMIWLDLDVELPPDTGIPSVEAHWGAVIPAILFWIFMLFIMLSIGNKLLTNLVYNHLFKYLHKFFIALFLLNTLQKIMNVLRWDVSGKYIPIKFILPVRNLCHLELLSSRVIM